jgi:uncharacterized membrane protein YgcG
MRIALAAVLAGLLAAQSAAAGPSSATGSEAVQTAPPADPAAAADTAAQIDAYLRGAPAIDLPREKNLGAVSSSDPAPPRQVHGEAGVSVGTGGYRSAYAISAFPVGKTGTVTLAVQDSRSGRNGGWGYGGGYGGYGGFRGGDRQSMSAAFSLGDSTDGACRRRALGDAAYGDLDLDRTRPACRSSDAWRRD